MSIEKLVLERSGNACELCGSKDSPKAHWVEAAPDETVDSHAVVCPTCLSQIQAPETADANHWRCLNDSMWSEVPAVQVLAWRMLNHLRAEGWPQDLLDMMYMDDATLNWARALEGQVKVVHKDVNGIVLQAGDSVVLIKDLPVKGTSMVAKRGTAVRRITLDPENSRYIEGKVNGQHIVIVTEYVKKSR